MTNYQIFELGFKYGWADKKQMLEAVELNIITAIEYEKITGRKYSLDS